MAGRVIRGKASSSSGPRQWVYDVFVSFRGVSTRLNFTSHLYKALREAGINAFRDDKNLQKGEDIPLSLQNAIWSSRVAVIVLSEDYADSRWCLEELASIMDCRRENKQLVIPIFYNISPSDVRRQMDRFQNAFLEHEKRFAKDKVARWKAVMTEVGNLSGWDITNFAYSDEAKTIEAVVRRILDELHHTHLVVAKFPIGIESRVQELSSLMEVGLEDVRFVGIWGMGGIGKTTLAKALYNKFFHFFDGSSFLSVRELTDHDGLVRLQEQLLSDILRLEDIKIGYFCDGNQVISHRLQGRKVLIVLDDVRDPKQLQRLAGQLNWFGSGSRIIVTTRNLDLLKEIQPTCIYNARALNEEEGLQLFSGHAFRNCSPKGEFLKLSKDIVNYSKGVPLVVEVLGSFLLGRTVEEWRSALLKLQEIPHSKIQSQLRISYDALSDDKEKDLFLDIACFFVGFNRDYAVKILNGCGLYAELGIKILTERCLLEVDKGNKLNMHDLIRDMGREIVREESTSNPGKRSRLWQFKDIETSLLNHIGTDEVQGIVMSPSWGSLKLNAETFEKMTRLRLLQLRRVHVEGNFKHLSKDLRWVSWPEFPLKSIPDEFCMTNLVALDMQNSSLVKAWKDDKCLGNLKVLNLSYSRYLTKTPNFLKLPNLEELILRGCVELIDVHSSIGHLKKLVTLDLKNCKQLKSIPDSICRVKTLRKLDISGCLKIDRLPEELGNMESLTEFLAEGTAITEVPVSMSQLRRLTNLSLSVHNRPNPSFLSTLFRWGHERNVMGRQAASLFQLSSLRTLRLTNCHLSNDTFVGMDNIANLPFLQNLDLSRNGFSRLPDGIGNLPQLETLILDNCTSLESLPRLPPNLSVLSVINNISLMVDHIGHELSYVQCRNCPCAFLDRFPASRSVICMNRWEDRADSSSHSSSSSKLQQFLRKDDEDAYWSSRWLQGTSKIPEWFDYKSTTPCLSFKMPSSIHQCNQQGVTICVVYEASETFTICTCREVLTYTVVVTNKGNKLELTHQSENDIGEVMHKDRAYMWLIQLPQKVVFRDELCFEGDVELEAGCSDESLKVLSVGVHFGDQICRYCHSSSSVMEDEYEHEPVGASSSRSNAAGMELSCEFDLMKLMSSKLSHIRRDRTTHELHDHIEEESEEDVDDQESSKIKKSESGKEPSTDRDSGSEPVSQVQSSRGMLFMDDNEREKKHLLEPETQFAPKMQKRKKM